MHGWAGISHSERLRRFPHTAGAKSSMLDSRLPHPCMRCEAGIPADRQSVRYAGEGFSFAAGIALPEGCWDSTMALSTACSSSHGGGFTHPCAPAGIEADLWQ